MPQRVKTAYVIVALLWVIYLLLTFLAPQQSSPFSLTPLASAFLSISVVLPFLVSWMAGCYAGATLLATVPAMHDREDKTAFTRIAAGAFALIFGLIIASVVSAVKPFVADDTNLTVFITVLTNYLYVLGPLIGFAFIYSGSGHLRRTASRGQSTWLLLLAVVLVIFATFYVWLTFTNPTRQVGLSTTIQASYFLPDYLIVATIIIPFLFSLVLTFLAIKRLVDYYRSVTGIIYRQAAMNLIIGCLSVISGANLLQALLSLGTTRLVGLGLGPLLLLVYIFLAFKAFGFLYLAFAARKFATIETVMRKYETDGSEA